MPCARILVALLLAVTTQAGAQTVVRSVSFRGNRSIDEATLRAAITTSQAPFPC